MAFPRIIPSLLSALVLLMVAAPATNAYNIAFGVYSNSTCSASSAIIDQAYDSNALACATVADIASVGLTASVQCTSNSASSAWNATFYAKNSCGSSGNVSSAAQVLFHQQGTGNKCYSFASGANAQAAGSVTFQALAALSYNVDCSGQVSPAATVGTSVMGIAALVVSTVLALVVA